MSFVADLHLHSSYAYATSSALTLDNLAHWAKLKGIDLLATADFTHPHWFQELKNNLVEAADGAYQYGGVNFVLGTEVSCVFRQGGRGRRVHVLVFAPDLETASAINDALSQVMATSSPMDALPLPSPPGIWLAGYWKSIPVAWWCRPMPGRPGTVSMGPSLALTASLRPLAT